MDFTVNYRVHAIVIEKQEENDGFDGFTYFDCVLLVDVDGIFCKCDQHCGGQVAYEEYKHNHGKSF